MNNLSSAESERLAILIEECAEVQELACKILRHGYESYNPDNEDAGDNRIQLEKELGDLKFVIHLLYERGDVNKDVVDFAAVDARMRKQKYLHYNKDKDYVKPTDDAK